MAHFTAWVSAFSPVRLSLYILSDYRQVTLGTNAHFACYTRHALFTKHLHFGCLSSTGHIQPNKPVKHQFFFPNWCQFILDNLLQELKAKRCRFDPWVMKITWSGTLVPSDSCDPMDCSLPGLCLHGISQARILEWVAISFSRGSSRPRNWTWVSYIAGRFFYHLSHQGILLLRDISKYRQGNLKSISRYMLDFILYSTDKTLQYVMNPYTFSKGIPKTEVAIKLSMTIINQMK